VNNASVGQRYLSGFLDTSVEEFDRVMAVNVRGAFLLCQAALPAMIERRAGVIVTISSSAGLTGGMPAIPSVSYGTSKAAEIGFTYALARNVARYGVLSAWTGALPSTPASIGVVGRIQSDIGAGTRPGCRRRCSRRRRQRSSSPPFRAERQLASAVS
jgi:NAD(P)-dependent dehydrogenase (short-subunit alcohol dehydrogenase family)